MNTKKKLPSLVTQLKTGMSQYVSLCILVIGLIGAGLHISWAIHQRSVLQERIRNAIAHTIQEPVRNHDWIAIKRTLQAFNFANENAIICVRLPDDIIMEQPSCYQPSYQEFKVPLKNESFLVSVKLPLFDWMTLAGVPFLIAALTLVLFISSYLKELARKTTSDLDLLFIQDKGVVLNFEELNDARNRIIASLELKAEASIGKIATQIAHDIRSPLAALAMLERDLSSIEEDKRVLVRSAVNRITDIANGLLLLSRKEKILNRETKDSLIDFSGRERVLEPLLSHLVPSMLEQIISEKRTQLRTRIGVEVNYLPSDSSYGLFAVVQQIEFKRLFSNLVNNAVESYDCGGPIFVKLESKNSKIHISIQDYGRGFNSEALEFLGHRGATFGKAEGTGLGIYHAKSSIESWGGKLIVESTENEGTTITIQLPIGSVPSWFVPKVDLSEIDSIVILDDDPSIHEVWKGKFDFLKGLKTTIDVFHFSVPSEIRNWVLHYSKKRRLFLVDYELADQAINGLSIIEELLIGSESILVTSRYEESEILAKCAELKVKIIPKGLACLVPVGLEALPSSGIT